MLDVLRHHELTGVLATVVRYFGGVKLGSGGLVRAYTDCVAQALAKASKVPLVPQRTLQCRVPYALEGLLRRELALVQAEVLGIEHEGQVVFTLRLPDDTADAWLARVNELAAGRVAWQSPAGQ